MSRDYELASPDIPIRGVVAQRYVNLEAARTTLKGKLVVALL